MEVIAEKPTLATGWWDVTTGERNDRLDVLNIFVSTFYLAPDRYCRAPSKASSPIRSLKSIYLSFLDPVEKKEEKRIHKGIFFVAILLNQSFSPSISTLFRPSSPYKAFHPLARKHLFGISLLFLSFSFFFFSFFLITRTLVGLKARARSGKNGFESNGLRNEIFACIKKEGEKKEKGEM